MPRGRRPSNVMEIEPEAVERNSRSNDRNGHTATLARPRTLSPDERAKAFRGTFDTEPFVDFLESMEMNEAYAWPVTPKTKRSIRTRLTRVAKSMNIRLRYAKDSPDDELIVERFVSKR